MAEPNNTPTNTPTPPTATTEEYGISTTVTGITIESYNVTEEPQEEKVPDQKNAVRNKILYDTRKVLKMTYRGTKLAPTNNVVTIDSVKWSVLTHEDAGVYNGLRRYNLTAERFDNYPA